MNNKSQIYFLRVSDNRVKLNRLFTTILNHFNKKDHICIFTPNQQSADYIDELLWKYSPDSFLPHEISDAISSEHIAITTTKTNINNATVFINLCPQALSNSIEGKIVYDLLDESLPEKEALSLQRHGAYQTVGFDVKVI